MTASSQNEIELAALQGSMVKKAKSESSSTVYSSGSRFWCAGIQYTACLCPDLNRSGLIHIIYQAKRRMSPRSRLRSFAPVGSVYFWAFPSIRSASAIRAAPSAGDGAYPAKARCALAARR